MEDVGGRWRWLNRALESSGAVNDVAGEPDAARVQDPGTAGKAAEPWRGSACDAMAG